VIFHCCDTRRRDAVANNSVLNGVDFVDVLDQDLQSPTAQQPDPDRQKLLLVHCLKPVTALAASNVVIDGGQRIRNIGVVWAVPASQILTAPSAPPAPGAAPVSPLVLKALKALDLPDHVLVVRVTQAGDFSIYTLRLVAGPSAPPVPGAAAAGPSLFDPLLLTVPFSFKVECPSDFDCAPPAACTTPPASAASPPPEIDYLAKDFGGFRRIMLQRIAQLIPSWTETSAADEGVVLAELLAYAADQLSYQQDAVATEAYLGTARRRVSLRRHATLVDYPMHDGRAARAWVQIDAQNDGDVFMLPRAGTQLLTRCDGSATALLAGSSDLATALLSKPAVFEPLHDLLISADHNEIRFHTWGDARCVLPLGATEATVIGPLPDLHPGAALLLEEVVSPTTGRLDDIDPTHRHIVRLTSVISGTDPLTNDAIVELGWAPEDALPFPLIISGRTDADHGSQDLPIVSIARGNILLADHGQTIVAEALPAVPPPSVVPTASGDCCAPAQATVVPPRFRPQLAAGPLSYASPAFTIPEKGGAPERGAFDTSGPAAGALIVDVADVLPQVALFDPAAPMAWQPQRSLLGSSAEDFNFVVEIDDQGMANLRFGDGEHGRRPDTGAQFLASYRIGNGAAGNVGAESIAHVVVADAAIVGRLGWTRNPVPAAGGLDPEDADSVRRNAPQALLKQQRAVSPDDYAAVAAAQPGVQRAVGRLRWTGAWHTMMVAVDPQAGRDPAAIEAPLPALLDQVRMAGQDVALASPTLVPLEVALLICVVDDYFRADVRAALLDALSNRVLPDGRRGLFHPDGLTFGQPVFLSAVYAAARAVPGVAAVQVTTFRRQGTIDNTALARGQIAIGRLEIARLDNDPNFPERGVLALNLQGGK
jgi:hypothetical protein